MNIVIVEDEKLIINRLQRMIEDYFGTGLSRLKCFQTLDDADDYLNQNSIDLLLLDLNLAGRDGFDLLKNVLSCSFHTIIVSANSNRAIEAFEFGVLDFVPKPFTRQRLNDALARFEENTVHQSMKYVCVRRHGKLELKPLSSVCFIKADNIYSELYFIDNEALLHDKSLRKFEQVLPENFKRVHKSYIVNMNHAKSVNRQGKDMFMITSNGQEIPISRRMHAEIKGMFI